ncbi:MAG TPA: hypothetical protein VH372_15285 [Actinospica sp.]|jgi:hypothetical protein|nr:hypothetical protein [Actinospica sp.]
MTTSGVSTAGVPGGPTQLSDRHVPAPAAHRPRSPRPPAAALLGLVLLALLGAWLVAAPFLLGVHGPGDQSRGGAWTAATRVDVSTGAVLLGVAVATLLGYLASSIVWLARYRQAE